MENRAIKTAQPTVKDFSYSYFDIIHEKSILTLRHWLADLDEEIELLKAANLTKANQWKDRSCRIKALNLKRFQEAIKDRIKTLSKLEREQKVFKLKNKAKTETSSTDAIVNIVKMFSRRGNAAAIAQERRNILANEQKPIAEIQAAPAIAPPPITNEDDQKLLKLIQDIQQNEPEISPAEAMLKAQAKVNAEGLPTEDFSLSQLLGQRPSKPEIEQEEQTNGK